MVHLFTLNEHGDDVCSCQVMLDTSACTVQFPDGPVVHLTDIEARLILELMRAKGAAVSKDALIAKIWCGYASDDTISQRVSALRKKIGRDKVLTVYGFGYRLNV